MVFHRSDRRPARCSPLPIWFPPISHRLRSSHRFAHVGRLELCRSDHSLLSDSDFERLSSCVIVIGGISDRLHPRDRLVFLAPGIRMGIRCRRRFTQASYDLNVGRPFDLNCCVPSCLVSIMYPLTLLNVLIRYLHTRVMYSHITLLYWAILGYGSHLEGL